MNKLQVQTLAYAQALELAYCCITQERHLLLEAGDELAVEAALIYRRKIAPAPDDPALFLKTFIATFAPAYRSAIVRLREGSLVVPTMADDERLALFCAIAEQELAREEVCDF